MRYWFALSGLVLACGSAPTAPSDVILIAGQEADAWTASPAPQSVRAELVVQGQRRVIAEGPAPTTGLSFDTAPPLPYGTVASFEISGLDAAGATVVHGTTVPFVITTLEGITVPVFAGRTGSWSRPPSPLEHPHMHPVVTTALHQYVIAAGGDDASANPIVPDFYDAGIWTTLQGQPPLPRIPKSMAVMKAALLTIDDTGATWLDLSNNATNDPAPPSGLTFAEVSGGATISLPDGSLCIVGATRSSGDATAKVLRIDTDGRLHALSLSTPRLGASAAVVGGTLLVAGGSADGPGVEALATTQDAFTALPFPSDSTVGLGLVESTAGTALLVGGMDPQGNAAAVRTLDPSCTADCAPVPLPLESPSLTRTALFAVGAGQVLAIGESSDGENHTFAIDLSGPSPAIAERALRERRKGATALLLPNGQVGMVGGVTPDTGATVSSLEAFFP